jgi:hypothetical protein
LDGEAAGAVVIAAGLIALTVAICWLGAMAVIFRLTR